MRHRFFESQNDAITYFKNIDKPGTEIYLAQASFKTNENRKQTNALAAKNFFLDIDCGVTKPYANQQAGINALKLFVKTTELPLPSIVISGNGLYAHWILDHEIPIENWSRIARVLKKVVGASEFKVDFGLTANSSCVLRPIGSTHRKDPGNPKPVRLLYEASDISLDEFTVPLFKAVKKFKLTSGLIGKSKQTDLNDEFAVYTSQESDLLKIAEKCSQVSYVRSQKGNVEEPMWYAFIGLARHCTNGESLIHEWSSGHPEYSVEDTTAKIEQHKNSGAGPTTCSFFFGLAPDRCLGCKLINKIKSPIVIGHPLPAHAEAPQNEVPEPPKPFLRTEKGLAYFDEGEGVPVIFYEEDLYPVSFQYDSSLECETATFRHHMKHEGWKEFTIKSSIIPDSKSLITTLWANHVKIIGQKGKKCMAQYIEGYMRELQNNRRLSNLCSQMGWQEDEGGLAFVHGTTAYYKERSPETVGFSRNVPSAAKGYKTSGELLPWIDLTSTLDTHKFAPYAFALCSGAFGAPLMRFTGYDGAIVALVGKTGHGKTLMQRWVQSAYGHHASLMMYKEDTKNALVARLGLYGSLPLTIDEISNIDAMDLSDLAYRVTQGRDKARLDVNSREKANLNKWNTLAIVSSNHSLLDRLAVAKADASAEINRVFEFELHRPEALDHILGAKIFNTIDMNYGLIGQIYLQEIVRNQDKHQENIANLTAEINKKAHCAPEERFWAAIAAVTIYGGLIARKIGIIKFEIAPLVDFACAAISAMRGEKKEMIRDAVTVIGDYLSDTRSNTLVVTDTIKRHTDAREIILPTGSLKNRVEFDSRTLFISVSSFREWAARKYTNVGETRRELIQIGAMYPLNSARKKVLGGGTPIAGAQQHCWVLDLKHPSIGQQAAQLVSDINAVEKESEAKWK